MEEHILKLPENIQRHLRGITETSGLPNTEESFALMAEIWLEKKQMFGSQIKTLDMQEVASMAKDDRKPALLLTYSGSLISLGALKEGKRTVEYASIKLRTDVPELAIIPETELVNDVKVDTCLEFSEGPIKSTSSLLTIACCKDNVKIEEQEMRIREASIFLTNGFTKVNRKITIDRGKAPEQFNIKAIAAYIAGKNGITQKQAKQIIDDYLFILEAGLLLGEKITVGRIGKLSLKKRPARKARVIMRPNTHEQMTIPAKPETSVPKLLFSRALKEKAQNVEIG
jgi:nucleoid DNA-binding protein